MRAIQIPDPVEEILNTLEAAGHRRLVRGGLRPGQPAGRPPGDWDVTTAALPEEDHGPVRGSGGAHRPPPRHRHRENGAGRAWRSPPSAGTGPTGTTGGRSP